MTSNVGSSAIAKGRSSIGFLIEDNETATYAGMKGLVMEELKAYFRPELLNRIDEVVVFQPLQKSQVCCILPFPAAIFLLKPFSIISFNHLFTFQMLEILNLMLREVKARLISLGIGLEVSESIKELVCQQGYDKAYGARPLRRAVTSIIEDPLSEALLSGNYKPGDTAVIDLDASGNPFVANSSDKTVHRSDTTSIF